MAGFLATAGFTGVVFAVAIATRPAIVHHGSEAVGNSCRGVGGGGWWDWGGGGDNL